MKDGFIKICAATPDIRVADCVYNRKKIAACIKAASENGAKVIVLPELCLTSYTCGDLFLQETLLKGAEEELEKLVYETAELDILAVVGLPFRLEQTLYNCAAVIYKGQVLALIPKSNIPNYGEFYEQRHFSAFAGKTVKAEIGGREIPFGTDILFTSPAIKGFSLAVEICEDLWTINPPSGRHAAAGATVIANLSASNELVAKDEYRRTLVCAQSARLIAAYIYADAGEGESTTDLVFSGDNMIFENGTQLARSKRFENGSIYAEADIGRLLAERLKNTTFNVSRPESYTVIPVNFAHEETQLTRYISKTPFVPDSEELKEKRCEEILAIQSLGLKKRLTHTGAKTAVIGISGGLDSTLALLATVRAFDSLKKDRSGIIAVTMPCFGTTDRTYTNAVNFSHSLNVSFREVNIRDAVSAHFADIGQEPDCFDTTFENAQARERTQVLMDIANKTGGLVVGTGDLSELALGWATYNGDHMSMYAVNAGIPKTLIRHLVDYEAERTSSDILRRTLEDILNTPVSPELLPPKDGQIAQKTEHIVGPYELHDFFLYHMIRFGFEPHKILRLAEYAFAGVYERPFILEWLKVFCRRFFSQQFKRSCLPDGPKVGSVALSPRGDWRMPSDACASLWLSQLEEM